MQNVADPTLLERLPGEEFLSTSDPALEHERLRMLADYTRFQIGLYTAVAAGVSLLAVWSGVRPWKLIPVYLLALAGLAVGVVAANLLEAREVASFRQTRIKPRLLGSRPSRLPLLRSYQRWRGWRAEAWQRLARTGFWLAVASFVGMTLAGAFVPAGSDPGGPPAPLPSAASVMPLPTVLPEESLPPRAAPASRREAFVRARPAEGRRNNSKAKPPQGARRAGRFPEYDGNR